MEDFGIPEIECLITETPKQVRGDKKGVNFKLKILNFKLKKSIWLALVMVAIFVLSFYYKNLVYQNLIADGDQNLAQRKYTLAYVDYQKADILQFFGDEAKKRQELAKSASGDILKLKPFLEEKKINNDLLSAINLSESKSCNLELDRKLISENYSQIAIINLNFCATEAKDFDSYLFLGVANLEMSKNSDIFKEDKPTYRQKAASVFESAYKIDPLSKTTLNYLIEVNRLLEKSDQVDHWQKMLDNLDKIQQ
ncbi:MAG: hypothetical protein Athens101428_282 [Candidatus Berkelbacteria bacterium Athens1014_28]|uniref:Uncharacterized protein n=1 Tax=Candidatus Berkelbacteria bacterium Athens1014_28 TaxID=2017145 RepID=A0A554LNG0_9BACT|nr:MAG: hypothetical protein Athens101428_282 [Candidatus Berkelbacteria bacterium Athens1014_28]